ALVSLKKKKSGCIWSDQRKISPTFWGSSNNVWIRFLLLVVTKTDGRIIRLITSIEGDAYPSDSLV
uniref:Uncharacterized protein n=1 Tax=Marmota marmota marmota TaxID=9994 RepID=A0A8C6EMT4_MARMA